MSHIYAKPALQTVQGWSLIMLTERCELQNSEMRLPEHLHSWCLYGGPTRSLVPVSTSPGAHHCYSSCRAQTYFRPHRVGLLSQIIDQMHGCRISIPLPV